MQLGPSQAGRHRRDRRQGMAADRAEPHAAANQAAGNGPRETGTVIGFNSVDNWRWVRPKFATDAKALVTGAEIADGEPLRSGEKVSFTRAEANYRKVTARLVNCPLRTDYLSVTPGAVKWLLPSASICSAGGSSRDRARPVQKSRHAGTR